MRRRTIKKVKQVGALERGKRQAVDRRALRVRVISPCDRLGKAERVTKKGDAFSWG
jgi:hypothetical protein